MQTPRVLVLRDGREIGPYSAEELRSRIALAVIDPEETCVDCETEEEWTCEEWLEECADSGANDDDDFDVDPDIVPDPPSDVLWQDHPSLLHYFPALATFLILTGGGIALMFWRIELWIGAALAAIGLIILAFILFLRSTRSYIISERRVEFIYGILSKSSQEILIEDIRAINVRKSGLLGLLGIGNVEFSSAGSTDVEVSFVNVRRASVVKQIVRDIQDDLADEYHDD